MTEIAYILDLLRAFYLVNYKNKVDKKKNKELFQEYIFDKIELMFDKYERFMKANHGSDYFLFKDWTATLLLKMKHRTYVYFYLKGMGVVVNEPAFNL